jgi:hypothetical protein
MLVGKVANKIKTKDNKHFALPARSPSAWIGAYGS